MQTTKILEIRSNGSKWAGQEPDTIDDLLHVLENYTLDPVFETYGNFVYPYVPIKWTENNLKFKGCTSISGNFYTLSHVFNIITNDQELINQITAVIRKNQSTEEYKQAREEQRESDLRGKAKQQLQFNSNDKLKDYIKETYNKTISNSPSYYECNEAIKRLTLNELEQFVIV